MAKKTVLRKRVWRVTLELVEMYDVVEKLPEGGESHRPEEKAVTLYTKHRDIDPQSTDASMDAIVSRVCGQEAF